MSDDLFKDCDCGDCGDCDCGDCGDCDCDCDCFDCECNCDDCLPGNNVIILCCCFPPAINNDPNRTNRDAPSDCCCCCWERRHYSPRRRRRERKNKRKKKGFCCWRLWCCFACKEPSPSPSPPRLGPDELPPRGYMRDGKYPMPEDLDSYMNDRWDRHHELDMLPRGYKSGGRYPMPGEMHMYRDEYYGRRDRWNEPKETRKDYRSGGRYGVDYYYRRDGRDEREALGMTSRDHEAERKKLGMDKLEASSTDYREHSRLAKREDLGKAAKDERKDEENTRSMVQDVPPTSYHGRDLRQEQPDELEISPYDYVKYDRYSSHGELDSPTHHGQGARASGSEEPPDMPHQDRGLQRMWSGRQSEH